MRNHISSLRMGGSQRFTNALITGLLLGIRDEAKIKLEFVFQISLST